MPSRLNKWNACLDLECYLVEIEGLGMTPFLNCIDLQVDIWNRSNLIVASFFFLLNSVAATKKMIQFICFGDLRSIKLIKFCNFLTIKNERVQQVETVKKHIGEPFTHHQPGGEHRQAEQEVDGGRDLHLAPQLASALLRHEPRAEAQVPA